jgi:hypothetical protein
MPERLLLCTDLDRTLIPNGPQPESPGAREIFSCVVNDTRVVLAYVTGRQRQLVWSVDEAAGYSARLYIARGGFRGMNGNYSAGILEGIAHYHPALLTQVCQEAMG